MSTEPVIYLLQGKMSDGAILPCLIFCWGKLSLDKLRNEDIRQDLEIYALNDKVQLAYIENVSTDTVEKSLKKDGWWTNY